MQCEQHQVACDFHVKTLHGDDYPSATPKPQRKEFIGLDPVRCIVSAEHRTPYGRGLILRLAGFLLTDFFAAYQAER